MKLFLSLSLGLGCTLALVVACFGPSLFRDEQFGYRDAAHFYYPLYLRVQQEWDAGRVPLWEPEENGGMPLLGNPTAAVLYPGKVIYALFPYDWGVRIYVVAHTLLALALTYVLLRAWHVSHTGAFLAGVTYAFGAPVLFQYCNVIFLVGAAWVPLGLLGADLWVQGGRRWGPLWLAVSLAMQGLGGDLQSAYVTGLCAGGYALGRAWATGAIRSRLSGTQVLVLLSAAFLAWVSVTLLLAVFLPVALRPEAGVNPKLLRPWPEWISPQLFPGKHGLTWLASARFWRAAVTLAWGTAGLVWLLRAVRRRSMGDRVLAGLLGAAGLAFALMGPQILPVLEYGRKTVRAVPESPHEIYPFSLEPYRLLELAWPNFYGSTLGANRSWLLMLPPWHPPKFWVPTLYVGGLGLVLALGAASLSRGDPRRVWMTWLVVLSLLASFGEFASPIYNVRNLRAAQPIFGPHDPTEQGEMRPDGFLRDGDGSPYWLLAWGLPEFYTFRYPSKLLTFTSLGLAALAGLGWDRLGHSRRSHRLAVLLVGTGLVGLLVTVAAGPAIQAAWNAAPLAKGRSPWGPFDARGALWDLQVALGHGTLLFVLGIVVLRLATHRPAAASAAILVLVTGDLLVANAGLVKTIPASELHGTPETLRIIQDAERANPSSGPYRIHRMPLWSPQNWATGESGDRVLDFAQWERKTIQPKYAIPFGAEYTITEGTAELYDYWFFFAPFRGNHDDEIGRRVGLGPGEKVVYFPRRGFDLWNTRYFVLPSRAQNDEHRSLATFLAESEAVAPDPKTFRGAEGRDRLEAWIETEDWQILRNKSAYPRAWVVHDARFIPPITDMNKESRAPWMEEMMYQADPFWNNPERRVWDPHSLAWLEVDDRAQGEIAPLLTRGPTLLSETPVIVHYDPQRVEIDVKLERPGIVVLADVFYPGWRLTVNDKPASILRTNRMMRGAALPAGRHRLIYRFQPLSFHMGLGLGVLGVLATVWLGIAAVRQEPKDTWEGIDKGH
jgi:hypothetical protein